MRGRFRAEVVHADFRILNVLSGLVLFARGLSSLECQMADHERACVPFERSRRLGLPGAFSALVCSVSAVSEVVAAFGGCELVDELADAVPERFSGAFAELSKESLEFGERQLDGVKVRAVWRQVGQGCSGLFDGFFDAGLLVAA